MSKAAGLSGWGPGSYKTMNRNKSESTLAETNAKLVERSMSILDEATIKGFMSMKTPPRQGEYGTRAMPSNVANMNEKANRLMAKPQSMFITGTDIDEGESRVSPHHDHPHHPHPPPPPPLLLLLLLDHALGPSVP